MRNGNNKPPVIARRGPGGGMPMGAMPGEKAKDFKKSMKSLLAYVKPFRVVMIISIVLAVLGTVFNIVGPQVIKGMGTVIMQGSALGHIDMGEIVYYGVILAILYVTSYLFSSLQGFLTSKVSARLSQKLRNEISEKINRLPIKTIDKESYGDILSRIVNDVDLLSHTLNQSLSSIITSLTMIIGVVVMMFINSVPLAIVGILGTPLSLVCVLVIVKLSQKFFAVQQESLGDINGHIEEMYSAHNVVSAFNAKEKSINKFNEINKNLYKSSYKAQYLSGIMHPVSHFVGNLVYIAVALVGGSMAIENPIFAVTIVAFISYLRMFNNQITQVASIANTLQSTAAASERVFEFLDYEEESVESREKEVGEIKGEVEFRNVCFGYDEDKEIIHDFNAKIAAGSKVAIVGPTGAGKTTLVNLLMRFYDIGSGDILIDGVSIYDYTRAQVRDMFGMVLQDTWLFEGSIRENVSYGTAGLSNEEIENACCFAHIDHFIRSLPNGYDMILDDSSNISQGQRQLLTIARAMVNNAPMLILDEATSTVDTITEAMIQKAMDKLMKGRTSFVIAHRLSTIKDADTIFVLKEGRVVECGNHEELLSQNGFYAELYNSQFAEGE